MKDSNLHRLQAKDKAIELQEEYQRKIMPLNRRIDMPSYEYYVQQKNIGLVDEKNDPIVSLPILFNWFDIVLHGTMNTKENSKLKIPFNSIREMSQFITYYKDEIKQLAKIIRGTELESNTSFAKKINDESIILELTDEQVKKISKEVNEKVEQPESRRKLKFELELELLTDLKAKKVTELKDNSLLELRISWLKKCSSYFLHDAKAGSLYLVSKANSDWSVLGGNKRIFATELFSPLDHNANQLKAFDKNYLIREAWKPELEDRLDKESSWFKTIIEESILPYPIPEKGLRVVELNKPLKDLIANLENNEENRVILFKKDAHLCSATENELEFICSLMLNKNYYTTFQQSTLLCSGRVIELIVLSLIKKVSKIDVQRILQGQPFYSLSYLAPTKPLVIKEDNMDRGDEGSNEKNSTSELDSEFITMFVDQINSWRETQMNKSVNPWLVYNVFNKYFNQVKIFNDPDMGRSYRNPLLKVCNKLQQSFNCLWSCFASFEKGIIFNTDDKVAFQNITEATRFEWTNSYKTNIAPLIKEEGKGSITYALQSHPLKIFIDKFNLKEFSLDELTEKSTTTVSNNKPKSHLEKTVRAAIIKGNSGKEHTLKEIKDDKSLDAEKIGQICKEIMDKSASSPLIAIDLKKINEELEKELKENKITLNNVPNTWKGKLKALLIRNNKSQP